MKTFAKILLSSAVLFVSFGLRAQISELNHDRADASPNSPLLAKLSYDTSTQIRGEQVRQVCIAVTAEGNYRVMRMTNEGPAQRLQGQIPKEELTQLKELLDDKKFRKLSGNHGRIIRRDAESFAAEIPRGNHAQRVRSLDADGEEPFPAPVAKLVEWLKDFDPKNGVPFERTEFQDVCPSEGFHLLQPSVAENRR